MHEIPTWALILRKKVERFEDSFFTQGKIPSNNIYQAKDSLIQIGALAIAALEHVLEVESIVLGADVEKLKEYFGKQKDTEQKPKEEE